MLNLLSAPDKAHLFFLSLSLSLDLERVFFETEPGFIFPSNTFLADSIPAPQCATEGYGNLEDSERMGGHKSETQINRQLGLSRKFNRK